MPSDYSLSLSPASHVQQPLHALVKGDHSRGEMGRETKRVPQLVTYDKGVPWPGQMQFHQFTNFISLCLNMTTTNQQFLRSSIQVPATVKVIITVSL